MNGDEKPAPPELMLTVQGVCLHCGSPFAYVIPNGARLKGFCNDCWEVIVAQRKAEDEKRSTLEKLDKIKFADGGNS